MNKKVFIIENQFLQFDDLRGFLKSEIDNPKPYDVYPKIDNPEDNNDRKKRQLPYVYFMDLVRIILNLQYNEEERKEALDLLTKQLVKIKPDLFIIDHNLVGLGIQDVKLCGIDLAIMISKIDSFKDTPILFLSRSLNNDPLVIDKLKELNIEEHNMRWVQKGYQGAVSYDLSYYKNNISTDLQYLLETPTMKINKVQSAKDLSILILATEWFSKHGGVSTFNRDLCKGLAKHKLNLVCVVPEYSKEEKEDANNHEVLLASQKLEYKKNPLSYYIKSLPDGFVPNIVIGHGRITGPEAKDQVESVYRDTPSLFRVHFVHIAPNEIELYKDSKNRIKNAEERGEHEKFFAEGADLITPVGPWLTSNTKEQYFPQTKDKELRSNKIYQFNPGFYKPVRRDIKELESDTCLILARAEDGELKGLDIGVRAMARFVSSHKTALRKPRLTIRGSLSGQGLKLKKEMEQVIIDDFRDNNLGPAPDLNIDVKEYTERAEDIKDDLNRASLLLMPSRTEGFGLVAIEAIAQGTPILVSHKSGIAELLNNELGHEDAKKFVVQMNSIDIEQTISIWKEKIEAVFLDKHSAFMNCQNIGDKLSNKISWESTTKQLIDKIIEQYDIFRSEKLK